MASIILPDDFRVNHRAASESLIRAVSAPIGSKAITEALDEATYFENEACKHVTSPRQKALAIGLLHAVDLIRAVADAEQVRS